LCIFEDTLWILKFLETDNEKTADKYIFDLSENLK
jgi:hypothetical protein